VSADVTDLAAYRCAIVCLTPDGRRIRFECLTLARRGMAERDIALALGLSERVVTILLGLKAQPSSG
jgi:hypothetical protein